MKPNKDTEYTEFTEWSEKLCEKRHDKLVELRKEKCGNNPFKKWFYLGKKVKMTKHRIIRFHDEIHFSCEIDNIKSYFEAKNILKKLQENNNTKDWFEISEYEVKGYSLEEYYNTPYDRLRWKAFKQWWKKIEKHGLVIKRPYMCYGKETYHIWNSRLEHKHCYKKFSSCWWKECFESILDIPRYHYKTCWYDYYDLFQTLIVKLTIKGLALGLFGNTVTHKEQMHEIWECRRELINTYNFEDYYAWKNNVDVLKDNPSYEWFKEREEKYKECTKKAFMLLADNIFDWWD